MMSSKTAELLIEMALFLRLPSDKFMWLWATTPDKAGLTERWIAKRCRNMRSDRDAKRAKLRRYAARLIAVQPLQSVPGDAERLAAEASELGLSLVQVSALSAMTPERRRQKLAAHRAYAAQVAQGRRRELEALAQQLHAEVGPHVVTDLSVWQVPNGGHDVAQ